MCYKKFLNRISRFFLISTAHSNDERRRKLLDVMLLATFIFSVIVIIIVFILADRMEEAANQDEMRLLELGGIITLVGIFFIYLLNKYTSNALAGTLFVLLFIALSSVTDTPIRVVDGRGLLTFTIPILASSVIIRPWASFPSAAACSISIALIGIFGADQPLPNIPAMAIFFLLAVIAWLSTRIMEKALANTRESRQSVQSIVENMPVMMDALDEDLHIIAWNRECERVTGYRAEEIVGNENAMKILYPEDEYRETLLSESAALDRNFRNTEWIITCKDGTQRTISWSNISKEFPIPGWHTWAIGVDITARKQAEEQRVAVEAQLRQSQKLESIGTLAGGVAHEINNPINGIMNYAQLILDRLGADHEVSGFATEIGRETERVATVVRNLLSFARDERKPSSPAQMHKIVESTLLLIRTIIKNDHVIVESNIPEDLPSVVCRGQQVQQVILNLLTNARDALNEKYPGYDENKKITISSHTFKKDGKEWLRTTVEDLGIGVPEEIIDVIFDPFFSTKPRDKGTGLGLSISHGIITDHGGSLSAESKPGEWTRFHIDLPISRETE